MTISAVSVIGLGKLGAPIAACIAAGGLEVLGVDMEPGKIRAVNAGDAAVSEPGLDHVMREAGRHLTATADLEEAVLSSDLTLVVVATPSEADGSFSLKHLMNVCEGIGRALRKKDLYHVVTVTSTVMPGSTEGVIRRILEQASGRTCGQDFGLCYSPEFVALGTVIHDFLNPDFILIGESDPRAGSTLEEMYRVVLANDPPAVRISLTNAELAKLAVNTFVTTKISFANMLARVCEQIPGGNVDEVTSALGLDSRIGPRYLKGAISYGGPCFPRDNLALSALVDSLGIPADLPQSTDRFNRWQLTWLADLVHAHIPPSGTAGVLGLSYKTGSDVTEEAPGTWLAGELAARGTSVTAFDPALIDRAPERLRNSVRFMPTARECVEESDVVALVVPWPDFRTIPADAWQRGSSSRTVVDCWGDLERLAELEGVQYVRPGTSAPLPDSLSHVLAGERVPRRVSDSL